jgi:outer membrane PBP1 activator LpoA protein
MIYLVQYDRAQAKLVKLQEFSAADKQRAEETRLFVELELLTSKTAHEVVLLEASNEEELRKTHRRYFERLEQLLEEGSTPSK